jgi:hypothetical protein
VGFFTSGVAGAGLSSTLAPFYCGVIPAFWITSFQRRMSLPSSCASCVGTKCVEAGQIQQRRNRGGGDIEHTPIFRAKAGQTFAWRCCKAHTGPVRKVVMAKPEGRQEELLIRRCEV